MTDAKKVYINGAWVNPNSTKEFPILSPTSEEKIGVTILGNQVDVDKAVAAAVDAFKDFSETPKEERIVLLETCIKSKNLT